MPLYKLKLIERQEIAQNTLLLSFEKPAELTFKPGQYGGFTLINPSETDAGGITRRFSLLSIPEDNLLSIATRVQNSAYKRVLKTLPLGSEIKFAGPTGTFTLHEDIAVPAVLLAGGIGIAPFYSMVRYAAHHHSAQSIHLFYGNACMSHAALLSELSALQQTYPAFKLIATLDKCEAGWSGETGFISPNMIKKYVPDILAPFYYICGSPTMVTTLQEMLVEMDIPEERIKVEDFPGY
ncbi:MAG TPA: FAD-dependent oxidoreductase [Gammaproteobacteria bacterium]|nr:FAD-dependent oxidoreductase [Gammaproteobacteria bacterium]